MLKEEETCSPLSSRHLTDFQPPHGHLWLPRGQALTRASSCPSWEARSGHKEVTYRQDSDPASAWTVGELGAVLFRVDFKYIIPPLIYCFLYIKLTTLLFYFTFSLFFPLSSLSLLLTLFSQFLFLFFFLYLFLHYYYISYFFQYM